MESIALGFADLFFNSAELQQGCCQRPWSCSS
jgi:hypothetical protein